VNQNHEFWVANNNSGTVSHYHVHHDKFSLISNIQVPSSDGVTPGNPTGIVLNQSNGFVISSGMVSGPSRLIVATEGGQILGYNPDVSLKFIQVYLNNNAKYKGIEIVGDFIYATDFSGNKIDTFDNTFALQNTYPFLDVSLPALYAPFNIAFFNNSLYVAYAVNNGDGDDLKGPSYGIINVFNTDGSIQRRLVSNNNLGALNSPWGLSLFSAEDFLIGNFGDGTIQKRDFFGNLESIISDDKQKLVRIEGLWSVRVVGKKIYFTAGPKSESAGVFGYLEQEEC